MFYGSISGNEWNTTADNQPFTVRQSFPTVFTLSDPYRNLPGGVGPFPFNYTPGSPRFTLPAQVFGPSLDFVWPLSYQTNVTVEKELGKSFSVTASYVGSFGRHLASGVDNNYPVFTSTATTANVNARRPYLPGTIGAGDRAVLDLRQRLQRPAGERRAPRHEADRGRRTTRSAAATRTSTSRAAACRACRTRRSSRRNAAGTPTIARTAWCCRACARSTICATRRRSRRVLARDWTVSAIATFQTGTPLTIAAGHRPQLRRPHQRSRRSRRQPGARSRPPDRRGD